MYDEQHFTRDAAVVRFDDDAPGVTVDEDGDPEFDWDEVETVSLDDPPHAEAFDTKEFFKIPATIARPIRQPYRVGSDTVFLKKPREELKRAAWSVDNAPWTHGHPKNEDGSRMVKSVDDIRGFWKNPRYIDAVDDLDADLMVPTNDEESKSYLEENTDVSVGFYNKIERVDEYDGIVGGTDDDTDEIDGYQTRMLFDHVASVEIGRCPSGAGCGIDSGPEHGHVDTLYKGRATTDKGRDEAESMDSDYEIAPSVDSFEEVTTDYRNSEGRYFAVSPEEGGGEPKFPINNCNDARDAWNLRSHGDISISVATLEERIRRRAGELDCSLPETAESSDAVDCGCEDEQNTDSIMEFEIDTEDLTPESVLSKVAEQHDGVEELLHDYREKAEAASDAADALDLDSADSLAETVGVMADELDDLRSFKDEAEREAMEEHAEAIVERTDRFGEEVDDVLEAHDDLEEIEATRELVEDLTESTDEQTANPGSETTDGGSSEATPQKYAKTPW